MILLITNIAVGIGLAGVETTPRPEDPTDLSHWKLTWSDEFTGDKLDESKWSIGLPWKGTDGSNRHHNNQYASYIQDDDVAVTDGALVLTTQRRDITGLNGRVFHYTQGLITTRGKFEQTYGYFEVRVKLPLEAGSGLWPAFWTLSDGWPPEMDICEVWTTGPRSHQGFAWRDKDGKVRWDDMNAHGALPTDWTTFGMEWGPGYQIYNMNGVVTKRVHGEHVTSMPQYLLLNSGVDANVPPTAQTVFPNAFRVDYVRVYARPDGPAILNGGFECEDRWPWKTYGRASWIGYSPHVGKTSLRLDDGSSAAEQRVFGLKPSTRYRVSASVKGLSAGFEARLGVKEHGAEEAFTRVTSVDWKSVTLDFTTGTQSTSALVYCYIPKDGGAAVFDDVEIVEVK